MNAVPIRLRQVPAGHGVTWVRQGFRVFFRRPIGFCGLFLVFLMAMQLVALLLPIGTLFAFGLLPFATLGFMIATQAAQGGKFPLPTAFIEPFRHGRSRSIAQLKLAGLYTLLMLAIGMVCWWVGGDAFDALEKAREANASSDELIQLSGDPGLKLATALLAVLTTVAAIPFWHAPALVHWAGQGAAQSLFSSTVSCWRNKGALSVFGLVWFGVITVSLFVAALLFALLGLTSMTVMILPPAVLIFATVFYSSLYFTFVDSFEPGNPAEADAEGLAPRIPS